MIKSKSKNSRNDDYFISVGFPETPQKHDFDYESFPSKLCGLPVWLTPPDVDISFFECADCKANLYFLMQIYCPLEEYKHCFHRYIYVFFCKDCWKKIDSIKVLRVQLPEKSEFYLTDKLINKELLAKNEQIEKINKKLNSLYPEYVIDSCQEVAEASRIYIKFYDKLDEKSLHSHTDEDDLDEDDLIVDHHTLKDEKVEKMISNYYKEEEDNKKDVSALEDECDFEIITKLQKNIFKNLEDIFFEVFSKVVSYDPKQILRYCRDDIFPLWFSNSGMLTMKNTKCKNCGGDVVFELQIMPNIFNLYKEILNINIGTIVIYTCNKSCSNKQKSYVEEFGFIQRTGEKIIDLNKPNNMSNANSITTTDDALVTNLNKLTVKNNADNEPDEDGWVEVKKKTKK